jgi:hypothetical protein
MVGSLKLASRQGVGRFDIDRIYTSKSVVAIKDLSKGESSLEVPVEGVQWNQAIQCLFFHFIPKVTVLEMSGVKLVMLILSIIR